jgi:EAL domain-containing protein (putative c-di-GMP-specific phosphodiesterase class I)
MQRESDHFVQMHNDILRGLEQQEFFLVYQPIFDLKAGQFNKCEALLRWQHPKEGLVPPLQFINVAERTGAIRAIGAWVLERSLIELKSLHACGFPVQLSINRSIQEFHVKEAAQSWLDTLHRHGIDEQYLIFEITESLLMEGMERQHANILTLKHAGVALAIDDFGTGYSALNYLRRYPVAYVKIDKSFITGIEDEAQALSLVAALIELSRSLGLKTIAEGVENQEQQTILEKLQCDYLQGFHLARPMKLNDTISFLKRDRAINAMSNRQY